MVVFSVHQITFRCIRIHLTEFQMLNDSSNKHYSLNILDWEQFFTKIGEWIHHSLQWISYKIFGLHLRLPIPVFNHVLCINFCLFRLEQKHFEFFYVEKRKPFFWILPYMQKKNDFRCGKWLWSLYVINIFIWYQHYAYMIMAWSYCV